MRLLPNHIRVFRYDPARRDEHGVYPPDEWTSISDVRTAGAGMAGYVEVENAYVAAATRIVEAVGVGRLTLSVDLHGPVAPDWLAAAFPDGAQLDLVATGDALRFMLREQLHGSLAAKDVALWVGYDLYLHVESAKPVPDDVLATVRELGLFHDHVFAEWRSPPSHAQAAWNRAFERLVRDPVTTRCPVCEDADLRFFFRFHRVADDGNRRGGYWIWCPACRRFDHGQAGAPDWWEDEPLPAEATLEPEPDWLNAHWHELDASRRLDDGRAGS